MKTSLLISALTLWLTAAAAEETPFYVRVAPTDEKAAPVVGLPGSVTVVIRNETSDKASGVIPPRALVLRGVEWVGQLRGAWRWNERLAGSAQENPDHSLSLKLEAGRHTQQFFELGLLLPGDEIAVTVPITPQSEEPPLLEITYAWAGESSSWADEILLPVEQKDGSSHFLPATTERVVARHNRGGLAALRTTLTVKEQQTPLPRQTYLVAVKLPLAPNPNYQLTGGISIIEAAWKSGADKLPAPRHGIYCAPLHTWIFTAKDLNGAAMAYERVPVEHPPFPPTAPPGFVPKPWKWVSHQLRMSLEAAALVGRGDGGSTAIRLDPSVFGDLVKVEGTEEQLVDVPADKLWAVLARAREKNLTLIGFMLFQEDADPDLSLGFMVLH